MFNIKKNEETRVENPLRYMFRRIPIAIIFFSKYPFQSLKIKLIGSNYFDHILIFQIIIYLSIILNMKNIIVPHY